MASYGEFSSLLQLGVALGIGLSLFRALVDIRAEKLARTLTGEIAAVDGIAGDFAKRKHRELLDIKFKFGRERRALETRIQPFLVGALFAAAANLAALTYGSMYASEGLSWSAQWLLVFLSVFSYVVIASFLYGIARWHLSPIEIELAACQARTDQE